MTILNLELFQNLLLWLSIFGIGWLIWTYLIKQGVDYITHPVLTSVYFLVLCIIAWFSFSEVLASITNKLDWWLLLPVLITLGINLFFNSILIKAIKTPKQAITKHPTGFIITLNPRYTISKYVEIFFQQILIITLVLLLYNSGLNLMQTIFWFALIFGLLHFPLVVLMDRFFGGFYFTGSVLSALILPPLIILNEYGFLYSYLTHLFFYLIGGVALRYYFNQTASRI